MEKKVCDCVFGDVVRNVDGEIVIVLATDFREFVFVLGRSPKTGKMEEQAMLPSAKVTWLKNMNWWASAVMTLNQPIEDGEWDPQFVEDYITDVE